MTGAAIVELNKVKCSPRSVQQAIVWPYIRFSTTIQAYSYGVKRKCKQKTLLTNLGDGELICARCKQLFCTVQTSDIVSTEIASIHGTHEEEVFECLSAEVFRNLPMC